MTWIKTISPDAAEGRLKKTYDRVSGPDGSVDNILAAQSLRPHSLEGHMVLYKAVLHHSGNRLEKWLLEAIGVHVSHLNGCDYCVAHHAAGLARLLDDEARTPEYIERMHSALTGGDLGDVFAGAELAALLYAAKLTRDPAGITEADVEALRTAGLDTPGLDDGEILEINQVTAYFAYANRTVLGLGVTIEGDDLGLSPNDNSDPDNWGHS